MTVATVHSGGRLDPRPPEWDFDLPELHTAGLRIGGGQAALLDPGCGVEEVLVVVALPDPLANHDGYRSFTELPPLHTRTPGGLVGTAVFPVLGRLDWSLDGVGELAGFHEPGWTRFPTVPVRLMIPDEHDEVDSFASAQRVWNVWPLSGEVSSDAIWSLLDCSERTLTAGWYAEACDWAALHLNRPGVDACTLVRDFDFEHVHHGDYCLTGTTRFEMLRGQLFVAGEPGVWRQPPPLRFEDPEAEGVWTELVTSSAANHLRALDVVPGWERAGLAATEKRYSPWVLS